MTRMAYPRATTTFLVLTLACALLFGAPRAQQPSTVTWADWVEPDFPFFSSVLDAGRAGVLFPARNLTPRGLVLNLGRDYWIGFDTDLLRVAAIWQGKGVTPRALAPGSYLEPDRKTPGGQSPLPEPNGTVWAANGIYPGWQGGADRPTLDDPREPAPTVAEVGRGPLPESLGKFKAVRLAGKGVVLEYTVRGVTVREWMRTSDGPTPAIVRSIRLDPAGEPLWLMLGYAQKGAFAVCRGNGETPVLEPLTAGADLGPVWTLKVPAHAAPVDVCVAISLPVRADAGTLQYESIPTAAPAVRWSQEVTTKVTVSTSS